MANHDSCSCVW